MRNSTAAILLVMLSTAVAPAQGNPDVTTARYSFTMKSVSIRMPDGVKLAATLYMPVGAPRETRFPVLLNYLPYRKDDGEAQEDYGLFSYFASRGFVGAAVDIRGFGESDGTPPDREYSAHERHDGEQVIAWLARQPWSNGKVGMFGISWGAFNSIQMAMRNPPALKAILAVEGTEKLFKEDVHYMDGIFHVDEFELDMDLSQGISGAPGFSLAQNVIGPRMNSRPWSLTYLQHQRDDAFWHRPERPLSAIHVPCFLIAGLHDGYRDSVPRMLEQVPAPVKAWIGPWNHAWPDDSDYGPLYAWRRQAVRWFAYWLEGKQTGVMHDPKVMIYLQHWYPPGIQDQSIPGVWRAESGWPPSGLWHQKLYLQPDRALSRTATAAGLNLLRYIPSVGKNSGIFWWGDLQPDQRLVDAHSLVYETKPLAHDVAVMGMPRVMIYAAASAPMADWFARLEDVAPDGQVTLVTGAGLNGAQRTSMSHPKYLVPGKFYAFSFALHLASYVFPKGHRIRLAISNAMWPMAWPTPYRMNTTVKLGGAQPSWLELPRVPLEGPRPPATLLEPPAPVAKRSDISGSDYLWPGSYTTLPDKDGRSRVVWQGTSNTSFPWGPLHRSEKLTYEVDNANPADSSVVGYSHYTQTVGTHVLSWRSHLALRSNQRDFFYTYKRKLLRDGRLIITHTWKRTIPRDHQ